MPLPEPGTPAPPIALPDQDGALVRLEDFAGTRVLVWFYSRAFGSN